jgi:hypothetical protein
MGLHLTFPIISNFKMKNVILIVSLIHLLILGCTEEYNLIPKNAEPRLVVEGLVSNKPGPYLIRLTESHTGKFVEPDFQNIDNAKGIMNALIIISDDANQVDTLKPMEFNRDDYEYDNRFGYYKVVFDVNGNTIDTLYWKYPADFNHERGFYMTTHLKGIPGRTYLLKVISEGKEYHANSYMPEVPDIDSISYFKKVMEKDGQEYYVPLLYFSEPQGVKNYYLIQLSEEMHNRLFSEMLWQFSILSDEFLEPYINGLNISLGETPRNFEYPWYFEGDSIYVGLSSLTKEAYNFYNSLRNQFKNDGGAYQLSPGSPPTNMTNGALGLFRASAISEKKIRIPYSFELAQ